MGASGRLVLISSALVLLMSHASSATYGQPPAGQAIPPAGMTVETAIDPAPYDAVLARDDWSSPSGERLSFCLLGDRSAARARTIAVYREDGSRWRRIYLDAERGFHPWSIATCELDGDSLPEIAVLVFKPTRQDPVADNRLFIYDWTREGHLFPKWLGSRLALPLVDCAFVPGPDGRDRLVTVEHRDRRWLVLRRYAWSGFGFTGERDLERIDAAGRYDPERERLVRQLRGPADTRGRPRWTLTRGGAR